MSKQIKWGNIPVEVGDGPRDIEHWVFSEDYTPGCFMGLDHITVFLPDYTVTMLCDGQSAHLDYEWCTFQADLRDMVEDWIDLASGDADLGEYGGDAREYAAKSLEILANVIRGQKIYRK